MGLSFEQQVRSGSCARIPAPLSLARPCCSWQNFAMKSAIHKNLHVPLPATLHRALRAAATREGRPATEVARSAIAEYLRGQRRRALEDELRAYVAAAAGSLDDLDQDLEAASIEHLAPRRRSR
jgi:hypothetical protein